MDLRERFQVAKNNLEFLERLEELLRFITVSIFFLSPVLLASRDILMTFSSPMNSHEGIGNSQANREHVWPREWYLPRLDDVRTFFVGNNA